MQHQAVSQHQAEAERLINHGYGILSIMRNSDGEVLQERQYITQVKQIAGSRVSLLIEHGKLDLEQISYWRKVREAIESYNL
jgi:hypothetical protein